MKGRGQGAARIANHKLIKHSENNKLIVAIESPIKFVGKSPKGANVPSDGYEATVLQEVCESVLLILWYVNYNIAKTLNSGICIQCVMPVTIFGDPSS